jgi:hypothetical protein
MTAARLARLFLSVCLACGSAFAQEAARTVEMSDGALLTLTGKVVMPDGSPASGAAVEATSNYNGDPAPKSVLADQSGSFRLRGLFGTGAHLFARSADGNHQTTLMIPEIMVREASAKSVDLKLTPAIEHEVSVVANGKPVANAHVAASGRNCFEVHGVTDSEGKARLKIPANDPLVGLVAWHKELGVAGIREVDSPQHRDFNKLVLSPPDLLAINVVDPQGKPVHDLPIAASVNVKDSGWAIVGKINEARQSTDAGGRVVLPWVPIENLKYVEVSILSDEWKIDRTDIDNLSLRVITVHARRKIPVEGRLVMPEGVNPEGLLVTGFAFGPGNQGDIPCVRARADGSFTLRAPSDHAYILGVADIQWASDMWTGLVLATDNSEPAEIKVTAQLATPLDIRVTRGEKHTPVVNAFVEVGNRADVKWVDAAGKQRSASAGIRSWLSTDADGLVRASAGPGKCNVRLASNTWDETKEIVVSSGKPVEVAFHRPWEGIRHLIGRLTGDPKYEPSPTMKAFAWSPRRDNLIPAMLKPAFKPDGSFKVDFDAENLVLLFIDPEQRRSGFAKVGLEESPVEIPMVPTARYGGIVTDEGGEPMRRQTLSLYVNGAGREAVATQKTDDTGAFRFAALPAEVWMRLSIGDGISSSAYFILENDRQFDRGEVRENDEVRSRRSDLGAAPAPPARPRAPLAERLASLRENVHAAGMRALVILQGDASPKVGALVTQILNDDRDPTILSYLTLSLSPLEIKADPDTLDKEGWPSPSHGEVVLVALGGDQKVLETKRIAPGREASIGDIDEFLKRNKPTARDALATLKAAQDEARKSGRRVLVVLGGPRCGPCFRLGRWMAEHHDLLEKDYVVAKVMGNLDEHYDDVFKQLPIADGDGIPWFAITEPDGTVLTHSRSAVGNIGFPTSLEARRHFRKMLDQTASRLTNDERDALIQSLSAKP